MGRLGEISMNVNVLVLRETSAWDNAGMADLVKVLSVPSIMEGEIVKARLEGEGIPVLLKGGGSDPYGMGVAYVFVPTEFEAQARLVLEDVSDETA
jgi:hypothetical protein